MDKKIGMNHSDRCKFCGEFGEKVEPFLCEKCRQKIFDWINEKGWTILTELLELGKIEENDK